jgi:hypothetical protein
MRRAVGESSLELPYPTPNSTAASAAQRLSGFQQGGHVPTLAAHRRMCDPTASVAAPHARGTPKSAGGAGGGGACGFSGGSSSSGSSGSGSGSGSNSSKRRRRQRHTVVVRGDADCALERVGPRVADGRRRAGSRRVDLGLAHARDHLQLTRGVQVVGRDAHLPLERRAGSEVAGPAHSMQSSAERSPSCAHKAGAAGAAAVGCATE